MKIKVVSARAIRFALTSIKRVNLTIESKQPSQVFTMYRWLPEFSMLEASALDLFDLFRCNCRWLSLALAASILLALPPAPKATAQTPKPVPVPRPAEPAPPPRESKPAESKASESKPEGKNEGRGVSTSEVKPAIREEHAPASDGEAEPAKPSGDSATTTTTKTPGRAVQRTAPVDVPSAGRIGSTTGSEGGTTRSGTRMLDRSQMRGSLEAETRLQSINAARARLTGLNHSPIPEGRIIANPGGRVTVMASGGRSYSLRPSGTLASFHAKGESATFRPDGRLAFFSSKQLSLRSGPHGERVITAHRPDHSTLVSTGRRSGYLESAPPPAGETAEANRPYVIQRTYLRGNRVWHRSYLSYSYKGRTLKRYLPGVTYPAGYYGWAWRGWPRPILYKWTWIGGRFYFYYRNYFVLWPSYSSASYWLTDYFLGEMLDDGYEMQDPDDGSGDATGDAGQQPDAPADDDEVYAPAATAISPEMKQAIAGEVQQQLALDSISAPPSANPDARLDASTAALAAPAEEPQFLQVGYVFVVDSLRNVSLAPATTDASTSSILVNRAHCNLAPGDVLRLAGVPPDSEDQPSRTVTTSAGTSVLMLDRPAFDQLEVMASQRGDCPAGTQVRMNINDLQEMEDNFEARLDDGLQLLHSKQGKDGIPAAPTADLTASAPPPADGPGAAELSAQLEVLESDANRAAAQLTQTVLAAQAPQ